MHFGHFRYFLNQNIFLGVMHMHDQAVLNLQNNDFVTACVMTCASMRCYQELCKCVMKHSMVHQSRLFFSNSTM